VLDQSRTETKFLVRGSLRGSPEVPPEADTSGA